jgi:tetratricopeptide (TPR) repeat protein
MSIGPSRLLMLALIAVVGTGCATATTAGRSALNQGRPDQAAERFEEALAENPDNFDALIGLGVARYRLGDYASAGASLERAVARRPAEQGARLYLGLTHLRQGNDASAVEQLTLLQALPMHPRFAAHVARTIDLLRGARLAEPVRGYVAADLEDTAGWAREVAETRQALAYAQLWSDPFYPYYGLHRPYYIRVHR